MMKTQSICLLVLCVMLAACGDDAASDNGPVTPPDNPNRDLPAKGGPDGTEEFETPDELFGVEQADPNEQALDAVDTTAACCPVTFAILDINGIDDETRVELVGTEAPLATPTSMTYADGVWSVEVCMPSSYPGRYHYDFVYEEGELSQTLDTFNEFAPNQDILGVSENIWIQADTCADAFVDEHSRTSN